MCLLTLDELGNKYAKKGASRQGKKEGRKKEAIKDSRRPRLDYKSLSVSIATVAEMV